MKKALMFVPLIMVWYALTYMSLFYEWSTLTYFLTCLVAGGIIGYVTGKAGYEA